MNPILAALLSALGTGPNAVGVAVKFISIVLPYVPTLVKDVESLFPASGSGPSKMTHVLDTIGAAAQAAPQLADKAEAIKTYMQPRVQMIVDVMKQLGATSLAANVADAAQQASAAVDTVAAGLGTGAGAPISTAAPSVGG